MERCCTQQYVASKSHLGDQRSCTCGGWFANLKLVRWIKIYNLRQRARGGTESAGVGLCLNSLRTASAGVAWGLLWGRARAERSAWVREPGLRRRWKGEVEGAGDPVESTASISRTSPISPLPAPTKRKVFPPSPGLTSPPETVGGGWREGETESRRLSQN